MFADIVHDIANSNHIVWFEFDFKKFCYCPKIDVQKQEATA